MKKVLVFMLVAGLLIGLFATVTEMEEGTLFQDADFSDSWIENNSGPSGPAPCGGGSGGGEPG
jgi:hypothetical protein